MTLKFYTSVAKGLKLKVRKFWGLSPTFLVVTGEKLVRGWEGDGGEAFCPPSCIGLILLTRIELWSRVVLVLITGNPGKIETLFMDKASKMKVIFV